MDFEKFFEIVFKWNKKICIFGTGCYGRGWVYSLLHDYSGLKIDFYCSNTESNGMINEVKIQPVSYLVENKADVYCFLAISKEKNAPVKQQLKELDITNVYYLEDDMFISELHAYIMKSGCHEYYYRFRPLMDDELYLKSMWNTVHHGEKPLDLENPQTINEKIQWLKINDRKPLYTLLADKYLVRDYIKNHFGEQYLIPLIYSTENYLDISSETLPDFPCIIKPNCGFGSYVIVRNKNDINWADLYNTLKIAMRRNYYCVSREYQYKDIPRRLLVEKLLLNKEGKIPNDYKLFFFNGKLEFIYCSIDREGRNYRKIYDPLWKPLNFVWYANARDLSISEGDEIEKPASLNKMVEIGEEIAKNICFVRVDFYDIEGSLYFGEITLHHGGGNDLFYPQKYDLYYGNKLKLKLT